jgi:hypothetical protein
MVQGLTTYHLLRLHLIQTVAMAVGLPWSHLLPQANLSQVYPFSAPYPHPSNPSLPSFVATLTPDLPPRPSVALPLFLPFPIFARVPLSLCQHKLPLCSCVC